MSHVLRYWVCLNADCRHDWEDGASAPACPRCGCVKVQWRPAGMHIRHAATTHADRTLRDVAERYHLTDLKSAREGEAAHPGLPRAKEIPGAPPLRLPGGIAIPRTMTPSASFPAMSHKIAGSLPVNGPRFKNAGPRIPTDMRYVDPTPIKR